MPVRKIRYGEYTIDTIFKSIKHSRTALELAVYLEQKGRGLYRELAGLADDDELKKFFLFLSKEEEKHLGQYSRLLENAGGAVSEKDAHVGEYGMFLSLLAQEATKTLAFDNDMTLIDSIKTALQFEKDTLLIFTEICTLFNEHDTNTIHEICEEEKRHIAQLIDYKNKIRNK